MSGWYRQSPALRSGAGFQGMSFSSPEEEIAFLRQQLGAAIDLVQKKDATEAACIERVTAVYVPIQERLQAELKARIRSMKRSEAALHLSASRYALLRSVRVRAMQIGIDNLSGEELDKALDQQAKQEVFS